MLRLLKILSRGVLGLTVSLPGEVSSSKQGLAVHLHLVHAAQQEDGFEEVVLGGASRRSEVSHTMWLGRDTAAAAIEWPCPQTLARFSTGPVPGKPCPTTSPGTARRACRRTAARTLSRASGCSSSPRCTRSRKRWREPASQRKISRGMRKMVSRCGLRRPRCCRAP